MVPQQSGQEEVSAFTSVEGFVEGDVAGSELEEEAGLVATKLGCYVDEVV